jgi:hypothetical protein
VVELAPPIPYTRLGDTHEESIIDGCGNAAVEHRLYCFVARLKVSMLLLRTNHFLAYRVTLQSY